MKEYLTKRNLFSWENLEQQLQSVIESGYSFHTLREYAEKKSAINSEYKVVIRIDIDFNLHRAQTLSDLLHRLGIKASFFVRLHAPEYNPFSFEGYRVIRSIIASGHELGYHSEIVDQAAIWSEDPADCLVRDIKTLETMFGVKIDGVASHGGTTGLNNLDFWKDHSPEQFGLMYEAYDDKGLDLFNKSLYVSDSEWTRWKCYDHGKLVQDDRRSIAEHAASKEAKLIYLLIHSDTYYTNHFYE